MKSTVLIFFYLAKDVVYRWRTHFSGLLARVLVAFLLTLCALIILANFLVMTASVEREIARAGGNLVVVSEMVPRERAAGSEPLFGPEAGEEADFSAAVFNEFHTTAKADDRHYPLAEYTLSAARFFSDFSALENGMFILPKERGAATFPRDVEIGGWTFRAMTIPPERAGTLANLYQSGAVFAPAGTFPELALFGQVKKTVFSAARLDAALLRRVEAAARSLVKLDGLSAHVQSSRALLERLERIRRDQISWRVAVSLGVAFIVGVLLTAISSMEFRRNEYVYALLSSFGASRLMLILAFVAENLFLVFAAAGAASIVFFRCLPLILDEVFKVRGVVLSVADLTPDLRLIAASLGVCVLVSALPIACAAFRPIGKVLK